MESRRVIILNIFNFDNPKNDLLYEIIDEFLFENRNWRTIDLFKVKNIEGEEEEFVEYILEYKNIIEDEENLYYIDRGEGSIIISFDEKEHYIVFREVIRALGWEDKLFTKKEMLKVVEKWKV